MTLNDIQNKDPLNESAAHLLHKVGQFANEVFAEEAGGSGLTPRQFAVLSVVGRHLDLSQTDLVGLTGIDRSTLADIVRRMLKKNLLTRRRTEQDQRAYAIRLSTEGQTLLDDHKLDAARADARILAAIPVELREPFMHALKSIVSSNDDGNPDVGTPDAETSQNTGVGETQPQSDHQEQDLKSGPEKKYANIRA